MGVSEWWLEIGYWGIVVGDWAPQLRDALTREKVAKDAKPRQEHGEADKGREAGRWAWLSDGPKCNP